MVYRKQKMFCPQTLKGKPKQKPYEKMTGKTGQIAGLYKSWWRVPFYKRAFVMRYIIINSKKAFFGISFRPAIGCTENIKISKSQRDSSTKHTQKYLSL